LTKPIGGGQYAEQELREWEAARAEHEPTDTDKERAAVALEWAREIPESEREDYLGNVNLVARMGYVTRKTAGVAASILAAHTRATGYGEQPRQEVRASEWVGEIGKRLDGLEVTCESVKGFEGQYGYCGIHKLVTAAGDRIVWFASGDGWIKEGETVTVSATVKGHNEFRGAKETAVSRVTVWTEEGVEKAKAKAERAAARAAKKAAKAVKVGAA
jgi:hypothetical protein